MKPMTKEKLDALHQEISAALDAATWKRRDAPEIEKKDANAYDGTVLDDNGGWLFLIVGFARGEAVHYAGTATRPGEGLIIHLVPELAAKAGELAKKAVP